MQDIHLVIFTSIFNCFSSRGERNLSGWGLEAKLSLTLWLSLFFLFFFPPTSSLWIAIVSLTKCGVAMFYTMICVKHTLAYG